MDDATTDLLRRCFDGDRAALDSIARRHRDWIHRHVRRHMGARLRSLQESEDVVQEVMIDLLQYGPAFIPASERQFRGLLARMVLNRFRELDRFGDAARRDLTRARALQSGEISRIGAYDASAARPDRRATEQEEAALVQVALGLLAVEEREIIERHRYDGLSFDEIGARLGIQAKAANKRFARAVARLGSQMRKLEKGDLHDLDAEASLDFDG